MTTFYLSYSNINIKNKNNKLKMKILTVKRLPTSEEEMNIVKEFFDDGEEIVFNIFNDVEGEPMGLRSATGLEVKFLEQLKTIMEKQNVDIKPEVKIIQSDDIVYKNDNE